MWSGRKPNRRLPLAVLTTILLLVLCGTGQFAPAAAAPSDIRFGAVEAYAAPDAAWQAGVAWERVRFHWAQIQAGGEGSWDDGEFTDALLAGELAGGRQVVGLLIGIPDWANENGIPRGLNLPHTDPGNTWATYVRTIVGRYAGRIDHWILWNEPDVWDSAHPGHTWNGTVDDFLQLNRVGYVTAKETNPNAVIHLAAVTHWWDAAYGRPLYFQRYLETLVADSNAAGNNYYFDVATLHLYFQPHYVYDITSYYYGLMGSVGIWKPIWIVETNAAPSLDPTWPVADPAFWVSLDEQAAYIPQALAMGMAAGAQRIAIYKMKDTPDDKAANPEPFGLIRADGSYRPAYYTMQVATGMLAGATRASRDRWDDVGQVRVEQDGGSTTVLFSRVPGPRTAEVPATSSSADLVDMWGRRQVVSAQDGVYRIELPAAPCSQSAGDYCMIGGPTYYLVQGNPAGGELPAPAAPAPSNAGTAEPPAGQPTDESSSATATATLAPTATPTATATATATATLTASPTASPTSSPTVTASPSVTPSPSSTATTVPPPTTPPTTATLLPSPKPTPLPSLASRVPAGLSILLVAGLATLGVGLVLLAWWQLRRP